MAEANLGNEEPSNNEVPTLSQQSRRNLFGRLNSMSEALQRTIGRIQNDTVAADTLGDELSRSFRFNVRQGTGQRHRIRQGHKIDKRKSKHLRMYLTCLQDPLTQRSNNLQLAELTKIGLGVPISERGQLNTGIGRQKSMMHLSWNAEALRQYVYEQFPALRGTEYDMCYSRVGGVLERIPSPLNTPDEIRVYLEDIRRTPGILFIRPRSFIAGVQQMNSTPSRTGNESRRSVPSAALGSPEQIQTGISDMDEGRSNQHRNQQPESQTQRDENIFESRGTPQNNETQTPRIRLQLDPLIDLGYDLPALDTEPEQEMNIDRPLITAEPDANPDELPVIITRRRSRRRQAAINAIDNIRGWCNRGSGQTNRQTTSTEHLIAAGRTEPVSPSTTSDFPDVIDSEDEELQAVLEASLTETSNTVEQRCLVDCLQELTEQLTSQTRPSTKIIIMRRNVLCSAFRAMNRPSFNTNASLYVKFSGELGEDHGGPRREFFRIVLRQLKDSSLFEGPEGKKCFAHNLEGLETHKFKMAGQLVGMSILQEGPGLYCLNNQLYQLMVGGEINLKNFDANELPDADVADILRQLQGISDFRQRDKFLSEHGQWLVDQGISNAWQLKIEEKDEMFARLIKHAIYYRCLAEITDFKTGVNDVLGLWQVIETNCKAFQPLFCDEQPILNHDEFVKIFHINWSEDGSNRKIAEEETIYSWDMFLQSIEEKELDVTFGQLLTFITGSENIPPLGFSSAIEIEFFTQESGVCRLPHASTCAMILYLPRETQEVDFQNMMNRAMKESSGFDKI